MNWQRKSSFSFSFFFLLKDLKRITMHTIQKMHFWHNEIVIIDREKVVMRIGKQKYKKSSAQAYQITLYDIMWTYCMYVHTCAMDTRIALSMSQELCKCDNICLFFFSLNENSLVCFGSFSCLFVLLCFFPFFFRFL